VTPSVLELLRQGNKKGIWERYCGFLDWDIGRYMREQRDLLEAQLPVYAESGLGRELWKGRKPRSVDEFRRMAPITTYRDYAARFASRNAEGLPAEPRAWVHTSGRSGEYDYKWVPLSQGMYEKVGEAALSSFILAAASGRGDVALKEGMTFPYTIAPPPYVTGVGAQRLLELFPFRVLPPLEEAEPMDFLERVRKAFAMALDEGMDYFFGITSIMIRIAETFRGLGAMRGGGPLPGPRGFLRLASAVVRSALRGRKPMPRDIWKVKGVLCGGMDTSILKRRVYELWGVEPLEAYVATEFGGIATQAWNKTGMTCFPDTNFWEFVSEEDYRRALADPDFIPETKLMDEVRPGVEYALVGTNFRLGALSRYAIGDLVSFTALEDQAIGIRLPQLSFVSRIDGLIDVGGLTRLTEKTIWRAIEETGIAYEDWLARKEYEGGKPVIRIYIETKGAAPPERGIADALHERLKGIDAPYREMETLSGIRPIRATRLTKGTFRRYGEERRAAGADIAHIKPPHVNASDKELERLMRMSAWRY